MDIFIKAAVCVLLSLVIYLVLLKQEKDISTLFSIMVCCVVAMTALSRFEPIIAFIGKLESKAGLNGDMLGVLLKVIGIGVIGEVTGLICNDAGNTALAKTLQLLSAVIILWLSLPLFESLLELIEEILVSI